MIVKLTVLIGYCCIAAYIADGFRIMSPRGISVSSSPCQPNEGFWFNKQPASIGVREGGRAFLECNVSNHCNIQFHWTLNDEIISNTTRRYQNGSNLVITRVNRTLDSGVFHCIATITTTGLARQSTPATLSIWWISKNASVALISPSRTEVDSGKAKEIELRCRVDGYDDLSFTWYHNGRVLKSTSGKYSVDKRRLTLLNVTAADNGVYSCMVENSAGVVRSYENFVLSLPGEHMPKLIKAPKDQLATVGSSVLFNCSYQNAQRIMWTKAETREPFNTYGRIRQLENDSLLFTDVKLQDEGAYECVAYGQVGSSKTPSSQGYVAWLTVAKLADFESSSFEPVRNLYVAGHGKPFELACTPPAGYPEPKVYRTRNGEKLAKQGRVRATEDLRLVIDSVRMEDQGEYECVAENSAGRRTGSVKLHVSKPPTIDYHPSSLHAEEGAPASFECKYKGNDYPVTVVDWEVNGTQLQSNVKDPRIKRYPQNGTLIIDSVALSDAGDYVCVVRTGDQKAVYSRAGRLTVRERLKFVPKPDDKKIELNSSAQIPCRATGQMPPKVKWLRAGAILPNGTVVKYLQPVTKFPDNIRDKEGTLYIHNARFEDAGLYTCAAASTQGVINETIKVEVFVYPTFTQGPQDEIVLEGSDVWFHCVVNGIPTPSAQWYFEKIPEAQWDKEKIIFKHYPNNTLHMMNVGVHQAGTYTCLAGNRGGFKSQSAYLCVKPHQSNYSNCGRSIQLIPPVGAPPGSSLNTQYRSSLEEAKRRQREQANGRLFVNQPSEPAPSDVPNEMSSADNGAVPMTTIAIACSAAAAYMFLVVCMVAYCAYRRRKQRDTKPADPAVTAQLLQQHQHQQIPMAVVGGDAVAPVVYNGTNRGHKYQPLANGTMNGHAGHSQMTPRSAGTNETHTPMILARENLQFVHLLGRGVYGEVYKMRLFSSTRTRPASPGSFVSTQTESTNDEWMEVLVKAMEATGNEWAREEWEQEMRMYCKLDHPNITKLLGMCVDAEPIYAIMEYLNYGNLKHYLYYSKLHKNTNTVSNVPLEYPPLLTPAQIVSICYQVAQAMEYLTDNRYVHKDLAARNVLLSPHYMAKITHLSLSENQFASEYFVYQNRTLPIRWMPGEALFDDEWSMKSDVWSMGIFIWELYTIGELPYVTMSNDEVVDVLRRGELRLLPPANAPSPVREIMLKCSSNDPRKRPTFTEIREILGQLHVDSGL